MEHQRQMGHDVGGPSFVPYSPPIQTPITPAESEKEDSGPFTIAFQVNDRETGERIIEILQEIAGRLGCVPYRVTSTDEPRARRRSIFEVAAARREKIQSLTIKGVNRQRARDRATGA